MQSSSVEFHKKSPEGYLRLGSVSGVFGFRGEAKIFLYNPKTELFGKWLTVFVLENKSVGKPLQLRLKKGSGKRVLGQIKTEGILIEDELQIRKMLGTELLLSEDDLPTLEDGVFYHHQLLDLPVEDEKGLLIGSIIEITQGVVDVFTIRCVGTKDVMYVPFTKQHVIQTTDKKMVIRSYDSTHLSD